MGPPTKASVRVIIDKHVGSRPFRRIVTALNADNVRDRNDDGEPDRPPRAGRCNRPLHHKAGEGDNRGIPLMTARQVRQSLLEPKRTPVQWGKDGSYVWKCSGSCRGARTANMHAEDLRLLDRGDRRQRRDAGVDQPQRRRRQHGLERPLRDEGPTQHVRLRQRHAS